MSYATLSEAISGSNAGDVIAISAGTYTEDFPKIRHSLTIEGVGGLASLRSLGSPSNGQAILVIDAASVTLDHLELSGAVVPDGNGAGIRFETGGSLTISHCWIHDNQDGLLAGAIAGATLSIDYSEIDHNGIEDGRTHNIYVNEIAQFTITHSYLHDALGGHEIKSRADVTVVTDNRITDGLNADTSYAVDLPNGGQATIAGNVIEKGPQSPNDAEIHFGGELFPSYAGSSLLVQNNIVTDDRQATPVLVLNQTQNGAGNPAPVQISDNQLYGIGPGQLSNAPATRSGNLFMPRPGPVLDMSHPFESPACYCAGTRIGTPNGEIAIEALQVGDLVTTHSGEAVTVLWIGRRCYDAGRVAANPQLRPVVIEAHALAPGVPARRLAVSPEHGLLVDGALIAAAALVNGVSVTRGGGAAVTYLHLAFARHEVIAAENCPAESFVDHAGRGMFVNSYPTSASAPVVSMRLPRLRGGHMVATAWRRIAGRAGVTEAAPSSGAMRGHVERIGRGMVEGWALVDAGPVRLEIIVDDGSMTEMLANFYRGDLDRAGLNDGRCGFLAPLPAGVCRVRVRRRLDRAGLAVAA